MEGESPMEAQVLGATRRPGTEKTTPRNASSREPQPATTREEKSSWERSRMWERSFMRHTQVKAVRAKGRVGLRAHFLQKVPTLSLRSN